MQTQFIEKDFEDILFKQCVTEGLADDDGQ